MRIVRTVFAIVIIIIVVEANPFTSNDSRAYIPNSVTAYYQNKIVEKAQSYLGAPYQYQGLSHSGIDCSGLTKNVYSEAGVNGSLPHNAASQYTATSSYYLPSSSTTGAIAFRGGANTASITHCGVRVNCSSGTFIHASSEHGVVEYTSSSFSWFTAPASWLY